MVMSLLLRLRSHCVPHTAHLYEKVSLGVAPPKNCLMPVSQHGHSPFRISPFCSPAC